MAEIYGLTEEAAKNAVEQYDKGRYPYGDMIALKVALVNGKTMAICLAYTLTNNSEIARISNMVAKPNENLISFRGQFLRSLIQLCSEQGYKKMIVSVMKDELPEFKKNFAKAGLNPQPVYARYEKEL